MSSSHPLCNLRVSRQEADTKLAERIDTGEALLSSAKQLREEVFSGVGYERVPDIKHTERHDSLWSEYSRWNDFNKALLERLFDSQEIATEYSTPKELEPTYGVLLAEIDEFENNLKDDLQKLRSIKERLPLFEEVLSRDLIQTAKSNAMNPKSFFGELKRRNVYKVAVAYAVVSWLLVQVATQVFPFLEIPNWVVRLVIALVVIGFPIALVIAWAFEATPEGIKPEAADSTPASASQKKYAWIYIVAIAAAISVALFFLGRYTTSKQASALPDVSAKSIAVLPLVNTSGDPGNDYFSDGLSEELIAVLAKIPDLKIIGRSSSFLFKGKSDDSRTIGEKLGVTNLLEGSVRKQGDRVRIVAELINAADGRTLWSDTYDRELKDVFAVQSEIATAVTEQLKIKLLGAPAKSDAAPSNDNLAAYNALLQGTFYFRLSTEEGTRKATEFYGEAIRLDSRYALAYANLSSAWRLLAAGWLGGAEAKEAYAKARKAAQTALSLAPDLSAAHEALGFALLTPDLDFAGAEAELRKAEKLAPADAGPKTALSILLAAQGRLAESENVARQALALDPLGVTRYLYLARILIGSGRFDEAEAALRKAVALQPAASRVHVHLATIDVLRGDATGALQNAQLEPPGGWRDYALALAEQTQSDRAAADAALQKLIKDNAVSSPFQIAAVYGLRNEPDKMFEWLDRAYTERDAGLTQLLVTPFILTHKNDPRFAAFCQKLKLPVPTTVVTKP